MESDLLTDIYTVAHSPSISGSALESLFRFFRALVHADNQIATHVVPNLVISSEKAAKGESNPANVARCIGQVVQAHLGVAAGTIAEYSKYLKVCLCHVLKVAAIWANCFLSTFVAGYEGKAISCCSELAHYGRARPLHVRLSLVLFGSRILTRIVGSDMANQKEIFALVVDHFSSDKEEIRSAAAFAAGEHRISILKITVDLNDFFQETSPSETCINSSPVSSR